MDARGFTPNNRDPVRLVDDIELAYVMTRYREVHDFWHVLLGLNADLLSEIAQKWVEMLQTGLPMWFARRSTCFAC
jgi:ubiquinone biosynthesis protein COQ4